MRLRILAIMLIFILAFMNALLPTNILSYGVRHVSINNVFSVKTYLVTYYFDQEHGGLLKQYTSNLYKRNITVSRYGLFINKSINALLYEIIPPPTTTGTLPRNWWPGILLRTSITYRVINKSIYKLTVKYKGFFSKYDLSLYKTIIFYYDKPYYIVEYKFINKGDKTLYFDLMSNWHRPVSFSIEIASAYHGSSLNDLQIYGLTSGDVIVHQGYSSWGTPNHMPEIHEGSIAYISLTSAPKEYSVGEGIIVKPLNNTINYTYGVWFEQAGYGVKNATPSSIIRLEMKSFKLLPGESKSFSFLVYVGPLISSILIDIGLKSLADTLRTYGVNVPDYIRGYGKPPYTLTLKFQSQEIPRINIVLYRIRDDGSLIRIYEAVPEYTITRIPIVKPGIYKLVINTTKGLTLDNNFEFSNLRIRESGSRTIVFDAYDDTVFNIEYSLRRIAWLNILLVDENNKPLIINGKTTNITITFTNSNGEKYVYYMDRNPKKIYLPIDDYNVVIKPLRIGNRSLSDLYFDNKYITLSINDDSASFRLENLNGGLHVLRLKYIPLTANIPIYTYVITVSILVVGVVIVFILLIYIRRRRYVR
jgi:hypothetical protein